MQNLILSQIKTLAFLVLLTFVLLISCSEKKQADDSSDVSVTGSDTLSSVPTLLEFVKSLQNQPPFNEDKAAKEKLNSLNQLLTELAKLSPGFKAIPSDPIPYDDGSDTSFMARRAKFKVEFARLIREKVFPNYFQIDRKSIEQLYAFGKEEKHDTLDVVRMYPIYDERLKDNTKYSYAFLWADKNDTGNQRNTKLVIDILDPCPPPGNCK